MVCGLPAGDEDLAVGEEVEGLAAVGLEVAEERALRPAEGEEGHGGRDADVDAGHGGDAFAIFLNFSGVDDAGE